MPHGGRDVFPFSPQRCCRHLQSLHRLQPANPTLNQGRNANAGAAAAAERWCCHLKAFCLNRKEKHPFRALTMRNAALLMASLLLGSMALAGGKRATAQGPSEQFATAEAMRVIPKGATITNTTCKSIDVGASSRYQCTITYSP
jgi:hypothetical protein